MSSVPTGHGGAVVCLPCVRKIGTPDQRSQCNCHAYAFHTTGTGSLVGFREPMVQLVGGTPVNIRGINFTNLTQVRFGDATGAYVKK